MPVIFDTGALARPAFTAADFAATKWDGGTGPGGDKAGGVALRQGFDSLWFGKHAGLSGEKRVYPGAQTRPIGWRQVELAAEIEARDLADLLSGPFRGDEAEREIRFATGLIPGGGFADEYGGKVGRAARAVNGLDNILWHYK
jgi:hypothetical protein